MEIKTRGYGADWRENPKIGFSFYKAKSEKKEERLLF